jgi:hypothetical protein
MVSSGHGSGFLPQWQQVQRAAAGAGERGGPRPAAGTAGCHRPVNEAASRRPYLNGGSYRMHANVHYRVVPGMGRDQIGLDGGPTSAVSRAAGSVRPMATVGSRPARMDTGDSGARE